MASEMASKFLQAQWAENAVNLKWEKLCVEVKHQNIEGLHILEECLTKQGGGIANNLKKKDPSCRSWGSPLKIGGKLSKFANKGKRLIIFPVWQHSSMSGANGHANDDHPPNFFVGFLHVTDDKSAKYKRTVYVYNAYNKGKSVPSQIRNMKTTGALTKVDPNFNLILGPQDKQNLNCVPLSIQYVEDLVFGKHTVEEVIAKLIEDVVVTCT